MHSLRHSFLPSIYLHRLPASCWQLFARSSIMKENQNKKKKQKNENNKKERDL